MLSVLLARSLLAGLTVFVPAEGWVRGTEIELGEVCRLSGSDPDLVGLASELPLGFAPAPGFSRMLTLERIQEELARAFPDQTIRITGERLCLARPEVEDLVPATLEAAVRLELQRTFEGVPATFTLAEPIAPLQIPRGHAESVLCARVPAGKRTSGALGVPLEIQVDGWCYRTVWTSWRVDVWETRPVLAPSKGDPTIFTVLRWARGTLAGAPWSRKDPSRPLPANSDG